MKTNIYILLILLLTFSFGDAQSTIKKSEIKSNEVISISVNEEVEDNVVVIDSVKAVEENKKDTLLIDAKELRESISKTSDIRLYLNRVRNVENIKVLFPKINKAVKA